MAEKCAMQFGEAVRLVSNMVKGGQQMDTFTFTAILNACQRANEAQVALEVFRYTANAVMQRAQCS